MKEEQNKYPEYINIAKREFDKVGKDDYYDDVVVWADVTKNKEHVNYVKWQWHDVLDAMPEDDAEVLVWCKNGQQSIARLEQKHNGSSVWVTTDPDLNVEDIRAWMNLPMSPDEADYEYR